MDSAARIEPSLFKTDNLDEGRTGNGSRYKANGHREVSILSPLRYPGSKRRLAGYVEEVLKVNNLRPALMIEPSRRALPKRSP